MSANLRYSIVLAGCLSFLLLACVPFLKNRAKPASAVSDESITKSTPTATDVRIGKALLDGIYGRYLAAGRDPPLNGWVLDEAQKAAISKGVKNWSDQEVDSVVNYIPYASSIGDDLTRDRIDMDVSDALLHRVIETRDRARVVHTFANCFIPWIWDGFSDRYSEWMLQKNGYDAVDILAEAYHGAASNEVRKWIIEAFVRAFPKLPLSGLKGEEVIAKCQTYYSSERSRLVLNVSYPRRNFYDFPNDPVVDGLFLSGAPTTRPSPKI